MKSDEARLHLEAAENFSDIAEVKAEEREENLRKAVEGYKKALLYFTREKSKTEFARIKNNLAVAYSTLADVRDKEANLGHAVEAYTEAFRIRTLENFPVQYAKTTSNLGRAYYQMDKFDDAETCFQAAFDTFKAQGLTIQAENERKWIDMVKERKSKSDKIEE
jgi:tetratricopeptide (TPR) repeat protein